jgi:hypothetical protein
MLKELGESIPVIWEEGLGVGGCIGLELINVEIAQS